jgi:hypothetical protein
MATHTPPNLRQRWGRGELTDEQVIGHLIQHLLIVYERLDKIEKQLRQPAAAPAETRKPQT